MSTRQAKLLEDIKQAFLHLEFSIKLLTYIELGKINKEEFDTNIMIPGSGIEADGLTRRRQYYY
jgi:hypothetical protein